MTRIHVPLVRTWSEIRAYLNWNPDQLAILAIVNLVALRSWAFRITFGPGEKVRLSVCPNLGLTLEEIKVLFAGRVPELLFADAITFLTSQGTLGTRPRDCWDTASSNPELILEGDGPVETVHEISFDGFFDTRLLPMMQSEQELRARLHNSTRFGSHKYRASGATVTWNVLGQTFSFRTSSRIEERKRATSLCFQREVFVGADVGSVHALTTPELQRHEFYHSDYGEIALRDYGLEAATVLPGSDRWIVELATPHLELDALGKLGPRESARRLIARVCSAIEQLTGSPDFQHHCSRVERRRLEQAAHSLALRQDVARQADYVYWRDRLLMKRPTSENELVALYMKLEAHNAIPFHRLRVVEYTRQAGIDALADFQKQSFEHQVVLAPVEFEFSFENCLRHEHPESQVRLVICWDFESDPPEIPSDASLATSEQGEWLYRLSRGAYSIDVIRLSRLPGLTVDHWRSS